MAPRGRSAQAVAAAAPVAANQLVAVSYDARTATAQKAVLAARESTLGATNIREYAFGHANLVTHVLSVPAPQVKRVMAALRGNPGVHSVGLTGSRRYATGITGSGYFQNDPYFDGFAVTNVPQSGGTPPPPTAGVPPLYEGPNVPGQWDMHDIRLEYAFGYAIAGYAGQYANPLALGSSGVKIAVIDTGEDTTHPELQSKIAYQRCFITDSATNVQSSSHFTTDEDGHGTDVAGIAAEQTNNGLGFTGAGGNALIYGYRVFPTPDDNCLNTTTTDTQCTANTPDIASAIEDAVAAHVNIISLSLGGGTCVNGADPDPVEGAAIADAIAANIIVVAASGNDSTAGSVTGVDAPGCDPGVIAVGASALADGFANGTNSNGSPTQQLEYVAAYSNTGSPGALVANAAAWGIVAPGGDPQGDTDGDDLHWIENIYTSTPFDSNFAGGCSGDYPTGTSVTDCRTLIAGTSMSTPHVAGVAALVLSVNPAFQSPALMKNLLCTTADDIGDPHEGCGRLDAYRAMAVAVNDPNVPAPYINP